MSLSWPWALIALLTVPFLLAFRWWMNRRRRKVAIRVSSVALIRAALPGRSLWRRRIPVFLFVLGLLILAVGISRPQASMAVPTNSTSILLAIDVSGSMCSTDVSPNRLTAARDAARQFVRGQDDGTRIGIVAFSGIAGVLVPPTTDKQKLLAALDSLKTARGTAIGLAILTSLDAIAESNPDVAPVGVDLSEGLSQAAGYVPDTIVVLTDGANTQGITPVTAAEQAAARRVRIYTIGFGTTQPSQMVCTPDQVGPDAALRPDGRGRGPGFGPPGGAGRFQLLDEPTLKKVAELTGGKYFRAQDSQQLTEVLSGLPREIVVQRKAMEVTVWFVLPGTLLVLAALALSLWWNRVVPARRQQ